MPPYCAKIYDIDTIAGKDGICVTWIICRPGKGLVALWFTCRFEAGTRLLIKGDRVIPMACARRFWPHLFDLKKTFPGFW